MKDRRTARELALQVLYACDMSVSNDPDEMLDYAGGEHGGAVQSRQYAGHLIHSVLDNREAIDEQLNRHSSNWDLKRMAAVDRAILRVGTAELLFSPDVPHKVAIDEAVEIAKLYGTDDSGRFVNGVLDAVYRARGTASRTT
jgi:N utilization substance protein B